MIDFRSEAPRLIAALTRIFGVHNLELVEDVVQDAFCRALDLWKVRGVPENPGAWLMAAARNRALDVLRSQRNARRFAPEMGRLLDTEWTLAPVVDESFEPSTIRDEQLRLMFSCCHPDLPEEVQLALVLHLLCGFGAAEIASAMLASRAAAEKRIARGKKALAELPHLFDLGNDDLATRLPTVQRALYLLFSEGYHGASAIRADLCRQAMRLSSLLLEHPVAAAPSSAGLASLMCLHAARLPARLDAAGDLSGLADQDRSLWDTTLVEQGLALLERSASGTELGTYQLEAAIAAVHAGARAVEDTDWATIVSLYDRLLEVSPSPVVALNRAIAVGERDGPEAGLEALGAIADRERLARYPFYPAALGEMELRRGDPAAARRHFRDAGELARNEAERRYLGRRADACGAGPS